MANAKRKMLVRLSVPLLLLTVGLILFFAGFRFGDLSNGLRWAGKWAPLLFVIAGVVSMSMMMPKTMVSLAAGALFGMQAGCPILFVTAVAAAAMNYSIGRFWIVSGGPDADATRIRAVETDRDIAENSGTISWPSALGVLARDAGFALHLLVRLSPIPTTLISYSMGAARARFSPYLSAAAVAVLPQLLYVYAASVATDVDRSLRYRSICSVSSLSVALIVSIALPQIAMKRLREIRGVRTAQ